MARFGGRTGRVTAELGRSPETCIGRIGGADRSARSNRRESGDPVDVERECDVCGRSYQAKTRRSRYCGQRCRKRAQRVAEVTPIHVDELSVAEATRRELRAAGRLETAAGMSAVKLAEKLDTGRDTGSAMAALSKQHLTALAEALRGVTLVSSPLDELRARREARLGGA